MNDRALGENAGRGDDVFGPLLGHFLERPEIFEAHVLPSLSVKDLFALAGVNRACRESLAEVEGMKWVRSNGVHGAVFRLLTVCGLKRGSGG